MNDNEPLLAQLTDEFDLAWRTSHRPSIEDFLNRVEGDARIALLQLRNKFSLPHKRTVSIF